MDYIISWTDSDPLYQEYFPDVRMLVSIPNVSQVWHISRWPSLPRTLMLDSGAFQFNRAGTMPLPEAVLRRQLAMVDGVTLPIQICHLDVPMLGTRNLAELERRVERNLHNARWLIDQATTGMLPAHIEPIGVIQGYSVERIYTTAQILADMGYTRFALGSLAGMVASARDELLRRVEAALEAVGTQLHILGVSSVRVLTDLVRLGVESADSGAPMHEAWRGGIFYSRPFRRYKLPSPHFDEWRRSYNFSELLTEPLPCDCPICRTDPLIILPLQRKKHINPRSVHNYYHLRRALQDEEAAADSPETPP